MTDQIKTIYSKFVSPVKKSTGIDLSEIGHAHAVNIILQELQNDNRTEKEKKDLRDYYRKSVYEYEKKNHKRIISIDAKGFVKAILKDAINGDIKMISR